MFISLFRPFCASLSPAHLLFRPVNGVIFGWYYIPWVQRVFATSPSKTSEYQLFIFKA